MKMEYTQQFYVKNNKELYLLDELKKCKICESINKTYKEMSICPECGRIVCQRHVKIDYLDKTRKMFPKNYEGGRNSTTD